MTLRSSNAVLTTATCLVSGREMRFDSHAEVKIEKQPIDETDEGNCHRLISSFFLIGILGAMFFTGNCCQLGSSKSSFEI